MRLVRRRYESEDDYWRIRAFLRRVFLLNDRKERSWHVARLDYWRWHGILNMGDGTLEDDVFLWEMEGGEIAAVLNREAPGQAYLQIDPRFDGRDLVEDMVASAEANLVTTRQDNSYVAVWSDAQDTQCTEILRARGYRPGKWAEHQWRRDLDAAIPAPSLPDGYQVRALGDERELPARSWASWRSFHPEAPDDEYQGWEWYANIQSAPLYRRDLDLVVAAATGEIVAFTTVWYDDVTRSAYFEPVGTVPDHQRRGLARAMMTEGLRRLQRLGATRAFVGGYEPGANALYASALSPQHDVSQQWVKSLASGAVEGRQVQDSG